MHPQLNNACIKRVEPAVASTVQWRQSHIAHICEYGGSVGIMVWCRLGYRRPIFTMHYRIFISSLRAPEEFSPGDRAAEAWSWPRASFSKRAKSVPPHVSSSPYMTLCFNIVTNQLTN
jgi:hypothetical protein